MKLEWRDVSLGGPAIHTSLTVAETNELQRLAAGKEVLEIGSAYGYSAIAMALAGAKVLAIDPHEQLRSRETMMANLDAYGVSASVDVLVGRSQEVLPEVFASGRVFDLVWIDGDHGVDAVRHDRVAGGAVLKDYGIMAFHDYGEDTCPGVREAVDEWFGEPESGCLVDTLAWFKMVLA